MSLLREAKHKLKHLCWVTVRILHSRFTSNHGNSMPLPTTLYSVPCYRVKPLLTRCEPHRSLLAGPKSVSILSVNPPCRDHTYSFTNSLFFRHILNFFSLKPSFLASLISLFLFYSTSAVWFSVAAQLHLQPQQEAVFSKKKRCKVTRDTISMRS